MVTLTAPEAIQAREDSRRACASGADVAACRKGTRSMAIPLASTASGAWISQRSSEPTFQGANLPGAWLREADLTDASLRRNLRDADLRDADLTRADLGGADLSGARLLGAQLADVRTEYGTTWPAGLRLRSKPDTDYGAWSSSCDTPRAYPPNALVLNRGRVGGSPCRSG